jgi:copper resistance protein B
MKTRSLLFLGACIVATQAGAAGMEDDPLLAKVMIDKLEWRAAEGPDPLAWDAQGWIGKDLNKLWLKTEGEAVDGKATGAELQALYSRAVAPFWDLQAGWRHDFRPRPSRDWLALGVQGLAPYEFDVDATLFAGGNGQLAARFRAEYELLFTQRLILSPEAEVNIYGKDDAVTGVGSGFSTLDLGLRLRYEIRRELAPYMGVNWAKKFGRTVDLAREEGEATDDLQFVLGIRAWF